MIKLSVGICSAFFISLSRDTWYLDNHDDQQLSMQSPCCRSVSSTQSDSERERSHASLQGMSIPMHDGGKKTVALRLYVSHALSTWNSRMFEFGAFLFLADIFTGTLLFASLYALARSLAVFLLSSWLGGLMDRSNRLVAIRHSISEER